MENGSCIIKKVMAMNLLCCSVCGARLTREGSAARCENGHSFDYAKEGYLNLLAGRRKAGASSGDSREMALARHDFLEKGYFAPLKAALEKEILKNGGSTGLDICCGEGYYSSALRERANDVYAFDLSKEMVRLAAKRKQAECFVANISAIPLPTGSIHMALHLFAPFHDAEFSRVMAPDGVLLTVVPGKRHLMGMKEVLYDAPYENDEAPPEALSFFIDKKQVVRARTKIIGQADIAALVHMTPYGVRSPREGLARLAQLDELETELEFVIYTLKRR